ncbi:MAG: LysR family transcriptional regulator [Spirochaetaceae bacterium]|nr:MAG: LysR family transcriptional regulator [Spirochaetaceae bacterium]
MDVVKLKAFCTVARLKSISRSAEALYYTQPAVSAQIRELENTYGTRLFRRVGQSIELTAAGETLLPHATALLKLFEQSRTLVSEAVGITNQSLTIGVSSMPSIHVLPQILADFRQTHSDIDVSITVRTASEIEDLISTGSVDVGIVGRTSGSRNRARLQNIALLQDPLVIVAPPDHPWVSRGDEPPSEDLAGQRFVLPPENTLTRRAVERWFRHLGVRPAVTQELTNTEAIKRMVIHGQGVSVLGRLVVAMEEKAGWLHAIPCRSLDLKRSVNLIYLNVDSDTLPEAARTFCAWITERFREQETSR